MSRFKLRIYLFFGVWSVVLFAAGLVLFGNVRKLAEEAHWVSHTHEVLDAVQTTLTALVDAETGQRGYLITGLTDYLEPYQFAMENLHGDIERMERLVQDNPAQEARIQGMKELIGARLEILKKNIDLNRSDPATARRAVASEQGKELMDAIRVQVADFRNTELALLAVRQRANAHAYRMVLLAWGVFGFLGFAGSGAPAPDSAACR